MIHKLIWGNLKAIAEGLRDLPINLLLLALAVFKAVLEDTQVQLIAILSVVIGLFTSYKLALIIFLAVYTACYFITNNVNAILKQIASRLHNQ